MKLTLFREETQGEYIFNFKKLGGLIIGFLLFASAVFLLIAIRNIFWAAFTLLVIGLYLILASIKTITINKKAGTIQVKTGYIYKKQQSLKYFYDFYVIRHYTNGVYSGTEIQLLFDLPHKENYSVMSLCNFRKSKKVEAMIEDINTITQD